MKYFIKNIPLPAPIIKLLVAWNFHWKIQLRLKYIQQKHRFQRYLYGFFTYKHPEIIRFIMDGRDKPDYQAKTKWYFGEGPPYGAP